MGIFDGVFSSADEMSTAEDVGYNSDGTFDYPVESVQVNDPSNTAGYPSATDSSALDILKYGVGVITDSWKFKQALDYKRFEATQGGVFQQGQNAGFRRVATGGINPAFIIAGVAALALLFVLKQKG